MDFQVANFQKCEHVQSHKLVHLSCRCHVLAPSTRVLFCVLYSILYGTVMKYLYFKSRMSGSQCKGSSEAAGTTITFKVLYCKIKNVSFIFCVFHALFV